MENIEYSVVILSPDPEEAQADLNHLADLGWRVVSVFSGDRVILERVKSSEFIRGRAGVLRVINEKRGSDPTPA